MQKLGTNNSLSPQVEKSNEILEDINENITGQTQSLSNIDSNTSQNNVILADINENITGQTQSLSNIDSNTSQSNVILTDINENITGQTQTLSNIDSNTDETNNLLTQLNNNLTGSTLSTTATLDMPTDANSSVQISQKVSLGSYVMDKVILENVISRANSNATQTYSNGVVTMSVGVGGYAIAQTFNRHPYFAGKSQRPEFSFEDLTTEVGVTKKVGYFSSNYVAPYNTGYDGFWLENDGTELKIGIGNGDTSGVTYIPQSDWNIDKLNGTGNSGKTLDLDKFTLCFADFLYLGGTAVRFGFNIGGENIWVHKHEHSNTSGGTIFSSPSQPLRWEIRSTGGTGSMKQLNGDVSTEGQQAIVGYPTSTIVQTNPVNANAIGVRYALAGIRLTSNDIGYKTNVLNPTMSYLVSTTDNAVIELWLNPTIAGTTTWTTLPNYSGVQYLEPSTANPSTNTVTGGILLYTTFVTQTKQEVDTLLSIVRRLGHSVDGVADELVMTIRPLANGSNTDAFGVMNFNIY